MFNRIFRSTKRWISNSSQNALEEAYQKALAIKKIEEEHFNSQKIDPKNCNYGDLVYEYFEQELKSNLQIINLKINQFKTSKSVHHFLDNSLKNNKNLQEIDYQKDIILERLNFMRDRFFAPLEYSKQKGWYYTDNNWRLPSISLIEFSPF